MLTENERLTYRTVSGHVALKRSCDGYNGEELLHLFAYELTGLKPDDITALQAAYDEKSDMVTNESEQLRGEIAQLQTELQKYRDDEAAGLLVRLPCKVGDTVYCLSWDCTNGMHYNCEHNGIMTGTKCRTCHLKPCDLHRAVVKEQVTSDLWLISEFCYGNFGKTVFITPDAAHAAMEGAEK